MPEMPTTAATRSFPVYFKELDVKTLDSLYIVAAADEEVSLDSSSNPMLLA